MKDKIISLEQDKSCPFCLSNNLDPIFLVNFKRALDSYHLNHAPKDQAHFFKCNECCCIFRNSFYILPENEEHLRYFTHNNDLDDPNYIKYLSDSIKPFLEHIKDDEFGLDFGCGPTKGIEHILKGKNFNLTSFDKYFYPSFKTSLIPNANSEIQSSSLLEADQQNLYDYIFCHEVVEHFVDTRHEFEHLIKKLKPKGRLFIRTEIYPEDFENWYYKNDSTHVFFFSEITFNYLAKLFNLEFLKLDKNKFVFIKK